MNKTIVADKSSKEYLAGYDAGLHGANKDNCHFELFMTEEQTAQWDMGKEDGLLAKEGKDI